MNELKKWLSRIKEHIIVKELSEKSRMEYKKICNHDFEDYKGIKTHKECMEWKCKKCGSLYNGF